MVKCFVVLTQGGWLDVEESYKRKEKGVVEERQVTPPRTTVAAGEITISSLYSPKREREMDIDIYISFALPTVLFEFLSSLKYRACDLSGRLDKLQDILLSRTTSLQAHEYIPPPNKLFFLISN